MTIFIISMILLLLAILIVFTVMYNRFQSYLIRINEAEASIDAVLRKRFDLLNRSISIINAHTKDDEEKKDALSMIVKLRSRKISNFELDRVLYEAINEFNDYKDCYEELHHNESFIKIDSSLSETEIEIHALRKYYNDVITGYNKLVRKIPSNIIAKVFKYKLKTYFDGKDMEDDDIHDFKL